MKEKRESREKGFLFCAPTFVSALALRRRQQGDHYQLAVAYVTQSRARPVCVCLFVCAPRKSFARPLLSLWSVGRLASFDQTGAVFGKGGRRETTASLAHLRRAKTGSRFASAAAAAAVDLIGRSRAEQKTMMKKPPDGRRKRASELLLLMTTTIETADGN